MKREAFNIVSKEVSDKYIGQDIEVKIPYEESIHTGKVLDVNEWGVVINWTSIDPLGFLVGEQTYPNVKNTLEDIHLVKKEHTIILQKGSYEAEKELLEKYIGKPLDLAIDGQDVHTIEITEVIREKDLITSFSYIVL